MSSRPSWKQPEQFTKETTETVDDVETGATVLGLHFMYQPIQERQASTMSNTPSFLQNNNSVVRLVSPPPPNSKVILILVWIPWHWL